MMKVEPIHDFKQVDMKFVWLFSPRAGFARSFGMRLANGERREWIKPIMFSGGLGSIEDAHVKKEGAEAGSYPSSARNAEAIFTHAPVDDSQRLCALLSSSGMQVVKMGGPVYRIGVGGGAASSVEVRMPQEAVPRVTSRGG